MKSKKTKLENLIEKYSGGCHCCKITELENGSFDVFNKILYDDKEYNDDLANYLNKHNYKAEVKFDKTQDAYYIIVK